MIEMADTHLAEAEIQAAMRVLHSGALRQGSECAAFEHEFAARFGARHAVSCANGSAALHLAYAALLEPGDEILVPSFTFFATASMAIQAGLKPILCDVEADTYLIDLNDAARKITARTRAIAPVHLFGNPCDIAQIQAFAAKHDLKIIWDAAQAHGALYDKKEVGGLSDAVCYSLYATKNLFVGEGGVVTATDDDVAHRIRFLRTHGQTAKYTHTMVGWNYRMTDISAAIGRAQLGRFDAMLQRRRRNAEILREGLAEVGGLRMQHITEGGRHAWHQFCLVVEPAFGTSRDDLVALLGKAGVRVGIHYPRGVHQQPVIVDMYGATNLPVTEMLCTRILALPVHHSVTDEQAHSIVSAVAAASLR